jgi:peptidoglycan L-alanyl-D-glutamate endopeptidase CwlK
MYSFGKTSLLKLTTCHPDIQRVLKECIKYMDFSVIEGLRTAEKQQEYFNKGLSQIDGIQKKSYHQDTYGDGYSRAVDIVPFHSGMQQWNDAKAFKRLTKIVFSISQKMLYNQQIKHYFEAGYLWSNFKDDPHWQIKTI